MCGIVGILGREPVAGQLVDALKRLEYRGYDSAGVATLERGALTRRRAEGKLRNLEQRLAKEPLNGTSGIGHTRWATHGKPTESNAHPHATERLAVVHNGIIENFRELRDELEKNGAKFGSETDTEVVAHLVTDEMKKGKKPAEAVKAALPRLRGAFALAFLFAGEEDMLIGARKGSPLAVGYGDGEMYLGSDAIALAPFTDTISYLEDGDWAVATRKGVQVYDEAGKPVKRQVLKSNASAFLVDKGNHKHFMAKEIHEQPEVVEHTLATLRYAREQKQHVLSVVNVPTSTIARESDAVMPTLAGPEIGVASTKAFTCQLSVLVCLAIAAGRARGVLSEEDERKLVRALVEVPRLMSEALRVEPQVEALARDLAKSRDVLYLGRGTAYPLALEGALKLKEISYIHAEGYAAGELKHGPIALIDETMPVIVIAPFDRVFDKTVSNMQEVAARGGKIVLVTDPKGAKEATVQSTTTLSMPEMPSTVTPLVYAIPVQLIAYHTAVALGTDVDQPRNLAKSVTVE